MPIDDRDDRRTPSNAPEELVMDLLASLQAADYAKAQPLIEKVLRYEPSNELMLEYRVVVQRALKRADDHADDDIHGGAAGGPGRGRAAGHGRRVKGERGLH